MSQLKVNTIRHTGASSDSITLASDGTATAKITNNLSNRNLIINGAMNVAQRGTSSTANTHATVDRFSNAFGGTDEALTQTQHDLTSSDTGPWEKGFRHSWHIQNGNQTGGAGAGDYVNPQYAVEAQDLACSGWDYTSSSSYITLSFWAKSSVAQTFYHYIRTLDGTNQRYSFSYSLSANTWTKITKKIPGNSNIQIDNNNEAGMGIYLSLFLGTDRTDSGVSVDTWGAYAGGTRTPDQTSTWYTTNDATFELTGVQLEVGDVATDFEHRPYSYELVRCQRYFRRDGGGQYTGYGIGVINGNAGGIWTFSLDPPMRAAPTITNDGNVRIYDGSANANVTGWNTNRSSAKNFWIEPTTSSNSFTSGKAFLVGNNDDTSGYLNLSAEL